MATLAQRTQDLEERVDSLESIPLASWSRTDLWMAKIDRSIARLERIIERMDQEGARDREARAREA